MPSEEIMPAARIRELSVINNDIATMLKTAGLALNTLTGRRNVDNDKGDDLEMTEEPVIDSLAARKSAFESQATEYYTNLQAVIARLRRQAYALEEAGIILPEAAALSTSTAAQRQAQPGARAGPATSLMPTSEAERITNGGLGNLDVGWLNSRGNKVGMEKENELVEQAKNLVQDILGETKPEPT